MPEGGTPIFGVSGVGCASNGGQATPIRCAVQLPDRRRIARQLSLVVPSPCSTMSPTGPAEVPPKAISARIRVRAACSSTSSFIAGPEPYGPSVGFAEDWSSDCRILIDSSSHAR